MKAPARFGFGQGRTLAEVDAADHMARARAYVPSIEAGARALRRLEETERRGFRPVQADIYAADAFALERLADRLDKEGRL